MSALTQDLREWNYEEFDPSDDPGNPYQHMLDTQDDDVEEDIKLGLSVWGMRR